MNDDKNDDRRKTLAVCRQGYESFRARATIPYSCCGNEEDDAVIRLLSSLSSSLSHSTEGPAKGDSSSDDGICRRSTLSSGTMRSRRLILDLIRQAVHTSVVANTLLEQGAGEAKDKSEKSTEESHTESIVTSHPRNAGKYTIIAFVNANSGGGMGNEIFKTLQTHLGTEYVIDLHSCGPGNMPEDTLKQFAHDPFVRVLACGGDGTCGWIYSSLDKVWSTILGSSSSKGRVDLSPFKDHLPLAIMPLGTGNDLSRQYSWGPRFQKHMKEKSIVLAVENADLLRLDRWRCLIMPMSTWGTEEKEIIPQILEEKDSSRNNPTEKMSATSRSLKSLAEFVKVMDNVDDKETKKSNKFVTNSNQPSTQYFDGLFCNYFSLGFDATVLYMFHSERQEHPEKFSSALRNKFVYVEKSPYGIRTPKLKKRIQIFVNDEKGNLVKLKIPKDARAVLLLNIQSYAGGNRMTTKGSPDDGLIEVIFVSNLIRAVASAIAGPVMPFVLFKVRAQTNRVCIRTKCPLHCQVDGEPWLQGEAVIQVKFHTRNAILKKTSTGMNCACASGSESAVVS